MKKAKRYVFPSKDAEIAFLKGELEYEEKKRYQAEQALREIVKILKKAEKPIKGEIIITGW